MGEQLYLDSNVKYCDLKDFNGSICNFQMSKYVKNGTWKWGNNFTLSPEKVSQVALFYTTEARKENQNSFTEAYLKRFKHL